MLRRGKAALRRFLNRLRERIRKVFTPRTVLVAGGVLCSIYGFFTVLGFVLEMREYNTLPADILLGQLIIPHTLMLSGFGMIVAGIIFIERRKVIHMRMTEEDE